MQLERDDRAQGILRRGVLLAGSLSTVIGFVGLMSWLLGYGARWSSMGFITVKTNMACGQLLAGCALLLLGGERPARWRRWASLGPALVVFAIGSLTLSEHLVGWNLGIDELIATESPGAAATASPNRMGPPGSTSLTLIGAALLLLIANRPMLVPFLGLLVCTIVLVPAVGFLFGIASFYSRARLTGIAWPTVVALFSMGIGLVLASTRSGPTVLLLRRDVGGETLRRMLPILALPAVIGLLRTWGENAGFFDTVTGRGLFVVTITLVLAVLLWRTADRTSRLDREQRAVQEAARQREERLRLSAEAARAEAERLNRVKDEFLATVSHELRTPLNAILGYAHLMRQCGVEGEVLESLDVIERNARSQAQIIEDLLDMGRIISGKIAIATVPVEVSAVVHAALETVAPVADARGVRIEMSLTPAPTVVVGDFERLQQVVWNLLSNAIKFSSAGGVVQVGLIAELGQARLTVSDQGQGIKPDFLPHIFDRFRQADASSTRRHGGLGLGLAIVKHLVDLHGGSISAHSGGPGHGARFEVVLPLSVRPTPHELVESIPGTTASRDARAGAEGTSLLAGLRILCVDDEADARHVVTRILSRHGAAVVTAASAPEALQKLETATFDVLVSDVGMPEQDGIDLIRTLRKRPASRGGRIPAAAITAFAREDDRRRALVSGFQSYIAKPVEPGELVNAVGSLAGRVSQGPSMTESSDGDAKVSAGAVSHRAPSC